MIFILFYVPVSPKNCEVLQVSRGDLIAASKADNVSLVKALLAAGADKNEKDTVGQRK